MCLIIFESIHLFDTCERERESEQWEISKLENLCSYSYMVVEKHRREGGREGGRGARGGGEGNAKTKKKITSKYIISLFKGKKGTIE